MNQKELIARVLSGQATPEEEQQLATLLRQEEDTKAWLTEDLTSDFDRLVAQRQPQPARRQWPRWAAAAVLVGVVVLGAQLLLQGVFQKSESSPSETKQPIAGTAALEDEGTATLELQTTPLPPPLKRRGTAAPSSPKAAASSTPGIASSTSRNAPSTPGMASSLPEPPLQTTDSLEYYIARLERSLDEVSDSIYQQRAEQIIRADARLQRLVKRIYLGEIERQQQKEEALYLKY